MNKDLSRTLVFDCLKKVGKDVKLSGWVRTRRDHGKLIFLDVRDRSGVVQIVVNQKVSEEAYKTATELRSEFVITVIGVVNKRPDHMVNAKLATGTVEVEARSIVLMNKAETLPFDIEVETLNLELPTLLDYRSLTLRHPKVKAIFAVQAAILEGFRKAAEKLGCSEIVVPTIVASSTEGGAELFGVNYYDYKAFLSQSPQLYKQMMVPVFERVWTIAHAYRAEPSVTTRHLAETTQMDLELGFVTFTDLLDLLEEVAVSMTKHAQESCKEIFSNLQLEPIAYGSPRSSPRGGAGAGGAGKIPRLTLREAQEIIYKEFKRDCRTEKDLAPQDEVDICAWAKKNHNSDFVTITHFPTKTKPFYTMPDPKNPEYSLSYDLLFRGIEILSGSQRVNDYQMLTDAIKSRGMDPKVFGMYLQAFAYGMPPEGGFSFGLERVTMKMLKLSNIREATLFPRDMERVDERLSKLR